MPLGFNCLAVRFLTGGHLRQLGSVAVLMSRLLTSIYICMLCALLLEATSSVLLPAKFRYRYSNSGAFRLTVSATPMPSPDPSSSSLTSYGSINCMIAVHSDITRCNNTYQQSLSKIIVRGYRPISKVYVRQYCCGFWTRERCVVEAIQRKCDKATFEHFDKGNNLYSSVADTRRSGIDCNDYEKNSQHCSGSKSSLSGTLVVLLLLFYSLFVLFS